MPIAFSLAPERALVTMVAEDPLQPSEVVETIASLSGDARASRVTTLYVDARNVRTAPDVAASASAVVLRLLRQNGIERVAVVVEDDAVSRTLQTVAERLEGEVALAVFRDADAARAWIEQSASLAASA